ncbi:hypothetical protein V1L54_28575 [Streptomyces sp. TRM 70361]|uniref:hypothetical protein n=1 Tax=Streptomyces sp. TRM 70361 TaxID=3116553 RepID=UPI002E7BC8A4|nr:hypothetical protein [Streptomyces sp. TRM 70361]MEE1943312.1 hypothetical protein [Streptomyces sp. TRM 70361]
MSAALLTGTPLTGRVAVVSGASSGMGAVTARRLAELGPKMVRVATVEPGMVDTELPDHVTDPDASALMAGLLRDIDCLRSDDIAETVAFMAAAPRHVNLTEITVMPTAQAI